jgi:hypothetical protein
MPSESTPLLDTRSCQERNSKGQDKDDLHRQFCMLSGVQYSGQSAGTKRSLLDHKTIYGRATRELSNQKLKYLITASFTNLLLLIEVAIGGALTILGAIHESYPVAALAAISTCIASLIAYLESRGQPVRAQMYRDDLERVVDEIDKSEVMWFGISNGLHGYDEIDTKEVTVRSEITRLTQLFAHTVSINSRIDHDVHTAEGSNGVPVASKERWLTLKPSTSIQSAPISTSMLAERTGDLGPANSTGVKPDSDESPVTVA